jgi:hypothetical protein
MSYRFKKIKGKNFHIDEEFQQRIEIHRKNLMKILDLKNTMAEIKNKLIDLTLRKTK